MKFSSIYSIITAALMFQGLNAYADESKHMVTFGANGLAWSGSVEQMSTEKSSGFDSITNIADNLSLNYAYRITKQQQIGFFYQTSNSEMKFKNRDGSETKSEQEMDAYGLFTIHNFSEDLRNAYYLALSFSMFNTEEEVSHDYTKAEGKAPIETDDNGLNYELAFGKRFSLEQFNVQQLAYAPQVSVFYRTHGKDYDDQGVKEGVGSVIQPIRFDLLF